MCLRFTPSASQTGKRYKPEQAIAKLREADILLGQGLSVPEVVRQLDVSKLTYYRWRKEYGGMKVEQAKRLKDMEKENAQLKRRRLWLNDGSCIRLRPERKNHVWAYDFVQGRTHDGKSFRMLTVIDEYTRECLAIYTQRRLKSLDVLECISDLMLVRGVPDHIRSDNGAEFTANLIKDWLKQIGVKTLHIEPGSPCVCEAGEERSDETKWLQ